MADLSNRFWFRRKKFGWGLEPGSTEGWIATVLFVIVGGRRFGVVAVCRKKRACDRDRLVGLLGGIVPDAGVS
ncbi:MAG TPA: hypothetical protein VGZ02_03815 [Candidatus Baltobacteraceae bacterium]|jgi:hypothetical protein|nr:hypothetical protein [Candidatus Baltobacteraceae bacterium]